MSTASDSGAESGGFKFYHYTPTFAGAVLFAVLFALVSIRHAQLLISKRIWFFIPFLVGCLCKSSQHRSHLHPRRANIKVDIKLRLRDTLREPFHRTSRLIGR